MQTTSMPNPRGLGQVAGALLGLAMLLLLRRYWGIDHDATLYLGQALLQRWPDTYGSDLFFAYGSQGRYTLFPWLLGHLIGWAPATSIFLWGALACLLIFAAAGWYCLRTLLPSDQRYWAWLAVLCLPTVYGRTVIFSYYESFLTPRPVAEALCLLGIGLMTARRYLAAMVCLAIAGLFHPLQVIAAALVIWPWAVMQDRRWLNLAWLGLPALLLAVAGIEPFDGLLQPLDPDWLSYLNATSGQLFVTGWAMVDYKMACFDALLLALAWRGLPLPFGRWCAAALVGLLAGVTASLLLVDVLHLVLPAGLQVWRVHWLAHWFAMATFGSLLFRDVQDRDWPRSLLLAFTGVMAWGTGGWLWLPFAILYAAWPRLDGIVRPGMKRFLGILCGLGMLALFADYAAGEFRTFQFAREQLQAYALDRRLLLFPLLAFGLPLAGVYAWTKAARNGRMLIMLGVLCPLVTFAAMRWDARQPIRLAIEQAAFQPDPFQATLPEGAQVYWDNISLLGSWLVLQRPDYFDPQQLSGIVFNRATLAAAIPRMIRMEPLIIESVACQDRSRTPEQRGNCRISVDWSVHLWCLS